MSQIVHIWPDDTNCLAEELHQMTHMSDDYVTVVMPDEDPYNVPTYDEAVGMRHDNRIQG